MMRLYNIQAQHTAVRDGGNTQYSYGEMNLLVDHICRSLQNAGIRSVAILAPQSYYAYCLIWAVYLSGGTFCCINVEYPPEKWQRCLKLFQPELVVVQDGISVECESTPVIAISSLIRDGIPNLLCNQVPSSPNEIAYVLFTSGSTGEPKGVRIRRKALEQVIESAVNIFQLTWQDIGGQFSSISFDMGICDVFCMFSVGVTAVVISGINKLFPAQAIAKNKITFWYSVPTVLDVMNRRGDISAGLLSSLRCVGFGGAQLFKHNVEQLFCANPSLTVVNTYGPTEITIFNAAVRFTKENYLHFCDGSVCIGFDIQNVHMSLRPVDTGLYEVVVHGDHVMDGYLANAGADYSTLKSGDQEFATGDIVRKQGNNLFFVARNDTQVKINGNRVDLGELSSAVRALGVVNEAVFLIDNTIVVFVECEECILSGMKEKLSAYLPSYCIPSLVIRVDHLPLNSNGKTDRVALKKIARQHLAEAEAKRNERKRN